MQLVNVSLEIRFRPRNGQPESTSTITESLPSDTPVSAFCKIVRTRAKIPPDVAITVEPQPLQLRVTNGTSVYHPTQNDGHLEISLHQPFINYFKNYRAEHGLLPQRPEYKQSRSTVHPHGKKRHDAKEASIHAGPAKLQFLRTLRVPDNADKYLLPPKLGTFSLVPVNQISTKLPPEISKRGGYLMPMFQREALWISFAGSGECAAKISVGGINAITGENQQSPFKEGIQDYVALPTQPWLDGICISPGVVRQFVAMQLGHGYTVEEQMTGRAVHGGIQIDIFPSLKHAIACESETVTKLDITRSPQELGLLPDAILRMTILCLPPCVTVKDLLSKGASELKINMVCREKGNVVVHTVTGKKMIDIDWEWSDTVNNLKEQIEDRQGIPPYQQRIVYAGKYLDDDCTRSEYNIPHGAVVHLIIRLCAGSHFPLEDARMGIAAGGQIQQKIYKDNHRANIYDEDARERVWIHTVSTDLWESITGVIAPITPIVPGTYKQYDYPWFNLYDEYLSELGATDRFRDLRSVRQLDNNTSAAVSTSSSQSSDLPDPTNPPYCSSHPIDKAGCVLRPCGHYGCGTCVGRVIMGGNECPVCRQSVSRMIGFQNPVSRVNVGGGSEGDWLAVEEKIGGIQVDDDYEEASVVTTIVLGEDNVSHLGGASASINI